MMCYQSDIIVGRTLSERMSHQSQRSTFLNEFISSDRKITDTDHWKMLNIGPDNQPGQIIGLPLVEM